MTSSRSFSRRVTETAICGLAFLASCGGGSDGSSASYSGKTLSALSEGEASEFCEDFAQLARSTLDQLESLAIDLPCEIMGILEDDEQACLVSRDACIANGGLPGADMTVSPEAMENLTADSCLQELETEDCDLTADQLFRCLRDMPGTLETAFGELNCGLAGDDEAFEAVAMQFSTLDPELELPSSCAVLEDSCFSTILN